MHCHTVVWVYVSNILSGSLFQSSFLCQGLKVSGKKKTVSFLLVEEIYGILSWIKSLQALKVSAEKAVGLSTTCSPLRLTATTRECFQTLLASLKAVSMITNVNSWYRGNTETSFYRPTKTPCNWLCFTSSMKFCNSWPCSSSIS